MVAHNYHGKTKNLMAKTKTSRQNQKPHGKTKYLTAKPKTSWQNQILHSKNKIALVLPWVFGFAVRYLVFAVKYLVLPWGLWFCGEGFGFVVRYFVFAVRFLFLPWGLRCCHEVVCFCHEVLVLPWGFGFAMTVVGHCSLYSSTKCLSRAVSSLNDHYFNQAILVFVHFSESSLYICQKWRSVRNWDFKKFYGYKKNQFSD